MTKWLEFLSQSINVFMQKKSNAIHVRLSVERIVTEEQVSINETIGKLYSIVKTTVSWKHTK